MKNKQYRKKLHRFDVQPEKNAFSQFSVDSDAKGGGNAG
jgi:hypothetical protein